MKEYELPEQWYIKITDDNKKIVNDWKIQQEYNDDLFRENYVHVGYDGCGYWEIFNDKEIYIEITTDQFIQYVLKQDVFPKNWAIRQDACQEACDWLNNNYPEYVNEKGEAKLTGAWEYITFKGKYSGNLNGYIEITKEQFIKHVLKEKHNYSKLINILKFIDESSRM
jgi:hypothetical protein